MKKILQEKQVKTMADIKHKKSQQELKFLENYVNEELHPITKTDSQNWGKIKKKFQRSY